MNDKIDSTSDARVVNNVMRHEYRVLSDLEKAQMKEIKDIGKEFYDYLTDMEFLYGTQPEASSTVPLALRTGSRELALAKTKIEEAVMWAVKHITR